MIFGSKGTSSETATMKLTTDMCRVCMMTSEYLKDVVSFELTPDIINMLSSFANIDVSMNHGLPSIICNKCYTRLMDSVNFKKLCVESNNTYNNFIMKMQNESLKVHQENKEMPPPKSASPNIIKIEELKRKDSESENVIEIVDTNNIEFITVKKIADMIEPSPELLSALGLMKATNNNNLENNKPNEEKNSNESINSVNNDKKDCISLNKTENISNNNKDCGKKEYTCKICCSVLHDYGVYRRHLATHGECPYTCKICGSRFSRARTLKEHTINTHSGSRPYACTLCTSNFITLNDLTVHLRKHAGNSEPHVCQMCHKRFSSAKQLREHSAIHENDRKPYERYKRSATGFGEHSCSQCDRKFRKKCDLERHERVHSGEKPYACLICGGKFQQAHNLTKHMVTHTGVRSFTCDICQKTFGRSDVLTRHMHVHEVSKPFNCPHCYRTFARQSQLNCHMVKKHPKVEN